jgi:hypothetical protein
MPRMNDILTLIGQLNYTWTNTESLLIHAIAGLARTDKETAIVIFLTLNTTRARLDLVTRLAKLRGAREGAAKEMLDVAARLGQEAKLRNKYNHCIYSFDSDGELSHTQLMRIADDAQGIRYGKVETLDDSELDRIKVSINNLVGINRKMWDISSRHGFPM